MTEKQENMLSIWFFVSVVLGMFGIIILGMGLYYAVVGVPEGPVLTETNPSLWWGVVMVVFSAALFFGDRFASKKQAD
jgi:hypothetical protein